MSGGSADDAVLAIVHRDGRTIVLDKIAKQIGPPPFDPRHAVARFCDTLHQYKISKVYGDAFAGQTFRKDFAARGIGYEVRSASASVLYERLEPVINAGELELLDQPTLIEQLVSLVWRGTKITHEHGAHDDHATALALALAVSVAHAAITRPKIVSPGVFSNGQWWGDVSSGYRQGNEPWRDHVNAGPDIGVRTFGPPPGSGPREW